MTTDKKEPPEPGGPGWAPAPGSADIEDDVAEIINAWHWIIVLAAPTLYRTIRRAVDPVYLTQLIDLLIAHAEQGVHYMSPQFRLVPYERRAPRARRLRALIVEWTPPDLPEEITIAARKLLHAEGQAPPEGGWDATETADSRPVEDILVWPEMAWSLRTRPRSAS